MNRKHLISSLLLCLITFCSLKADVKLPGYFSDNMVIQRDAPVKIWGWADKNENVSIRFNGKSLNTKAGNNGTWEVTLPAMAFGGPYTMTVKGKNNSIELSNILIGDVWYCGGQSNMEWNVKNSMNAAKEIEMADYPQIRSLRAPNIISPVPLENFDAKWEICSPETAGNFTAVGYFFARKLYQELNVPIGIINVSWGGTGVETWTSKDSYDKMPQNAKIKYDIDLSENTDFDAFFKVQAEKRNAFFNALKNDIGLTERWFEPSTGYSLWNDIETPKAWGSTKELNGLLGNMWYNFAVNLPEENAGKPATISLGKIDDDDILWINGVQIGSTQGYNIRRIYDVPAGILKAGTNNITIMVSSPAGEGGLLSAPDEYYLQINGGNNTNYSLTGVWKYKISTSNREYEFVETGPNMAPSLLYNGMTNPLINYRIKGAIWYQGEHNTNQSYAYRVLFPNLINNWRSKWGYQFPFYWVQLANFMAKDEFPAESGWAELREAQTMTLSLPETGEAVIIDIGEAEDIHPRNKQDVGLRLALIALNKDYGKNNIFSGPTFKSYEINGDKVTITFENTGSGLCTPDKYGYITGFAVAGQNKVFEWAQAYIYGNKVVVSSNKVKNPVAVRYLWGNNPDANLYNKEGLPARPFRTDSWRGITE